MAHLIIVRGLPGSGKSTYAKNMADKRNMNHYEADMFFEQSGTYIFQPHRIRFAHQWCRDKVFRSLNEGHNTIVSNTFCQYWEAKPYIEYCKENNHTFSFVVCESEYQSIHDVPEDTVNKMRNRWEDFSCAS